MRNCKLTCKGKEYEVKSGTLLSEFLRREGISAEMPCGGMGRCGKCRVRFINGAPAATTADRRFFSEDEIGSGLRLSCRAVITGDAEIEVMHSESALIADSDGTNPQKGGLDECKIAVDLGTTTIAAALISKDGNKIVRKSVTMNHQKSFGADVISRIKAATEGNDKRLRELVVSDILEVVGNLLVDERTVVSEIIIAGNTTMLHLLAGDSCEGLGKAPYKPARLKYPKMKFEEIFGSEKADFDTESCSCRLMPGISAFVGADIVAGMYELSFDEIPEGKTYMLIDLGTNGEMAVADSEKITVCSTAAGPVFEGGGISCGMAGVIGAIEHVRIDEETRGCDCETIGDVKPSGICGSGVLETVSELRRCGIVDETGLLSDEYFDNGYVLYNKDGINIVFSQNDIRAVQLAKAAIRSGIETLLSEHGCGISDIDKVYIAGGFSEHLDIEKIRYLKLLPEDFLERNITECVGNTSLKGCVKALCDRDFIDRTEKILKSANEVTLADTHGFEENFFDAMNL